MYVLMFSRREVGGTFAIETSVTIFYKFSVFPTRGRKVTFAVMTYVTIVYDFSVIQREKRGYFCNFSLRLFRSSLYKH